MHIHGLLDVFVIGVKLFVGWLGPPYRDNGDANAGLFVFVFVFVFVFDFGLVFAIMRRARKIDDALHLVIE